MATEYIEKNHYGYHGFGEWWRNYWRPMFGLTYIIICLFDFLIMPVAYSIIYDRKNLTNIIEMVKDMPDQVQYKVLENLISVRVWKPITLQEGAFFHLSFGAVLTGAAVTRGIAQNNLAKQGIDPWHAWHGPMNGHGFKENDGKG